MDFGAAVLARKAGAVTSAVEAGELLIAMTDLQRVGVDRCAPVFVVHYDGEGFRRM